MPFVFNEMILTSSNDSPVDLFPSSEDMPKLPPPTYLTKFEINSYSSSGCEKFSKNESKVVSSSNNMSISKKIKVRFK